MNRIFTIVLVAMFVLAGTISSSYAQSATDINGIKISASGAFGFIASHQKQGNLSVANLGAGDRLSVGHGVYGNHDTNEVEYVLSLMFEKTFSNDGTAFIKIKGGGVTGAEGSLGLGWFRPGIDDDSYANADDIVINELHYTQPLGDLWSIKVGRFGDAGSPNDVASSVGAFFLGDPTIPGARGGSWQNPYGVQIDYSPIPLLSVEYQYLTQAYTHDYDGDEVTYDQPNAFKVTRTPYNVFFVNFKPIENGNYRIGYWQDTAKREFVNYRDITIGDETYSIQQGGGAEPQGIFLSFDQQIVENLSAFLRGGYRLDETIGSGPGQAKTSWQIGAKVGGSFWGRAKDSIFIGIGQAQAQENVELFNLGSLPFSYSYSYPAGKDGSGDPVTGHKTVTVPPKPYGENYEKPKAETHFEINYLLNINEQVSVVFFGQYVGDIYTIKAYAEDPQDEYDPDNNPDFPLYPEQSYGYAGGLKLVLAF